jgi:hypothetical protein
MISDDDLILYHYRDGLDAAERARIGAALSEKPELAQRLQVLITRLDAAAALPEVPVPAEVQQRWQAALERAQQQEVVSGAHHAPAERRWSLAYLRWPGAVAATVIAVALIFQFTRQSPPELTAEVGAPESASPTDATAYERGLKWHLASTEQQLAGIGSATPEERARLIETIAAQNRMYALAAERAGELQLARVLRAFAPILESLAQDGGDNSASLAQLSFELRVMQGRLKAGADAPSTTL